MVAPVVSLWTPTGASEDPDVNVSVRVFDNDSDFVEASILLDLVDPDANTINVIVAGVFQAPYNGTINTVGKETFITVNTHPLFDIGTWQALFFGQDATFNPAAKAWNFTVDTDAIALSNQKPSGVKTGTLDQISFVLDDAWGLDLTTLNFTLKSPLNERTPAIVAGAIQSGFTGVIIQLDDPGTGPRKVEVILKTWPELMNGALYTFELDVSNIVGKAI